jgi:hypothetical protein
MTKMKPEGWDQLSRSSKLAAVMWPDLAPKHIQAEMKAISCGEGKLDPLGGKARAAVSKLHVRNCIFDPGRQEAFRFY